MYSSISGTACPSHHISKKSYCYSPEISSSIKKRQPSSVDLLKMGTTETSPVEYNSKIVRPKPIELLNERRKMHEKEPLKVSLVPDDKLGDPITDNKYFDALLEAKKEVKLSYNVKEKMSSLLQAIRQEQDLVESDLEKKSEEATVKKGSFRISSEFHRDGEVESRSDKEVHNDHVMQHKLLSPTLVKPNKSVTPDIVKHTVCIKNQIVGDIQTNNKSDANQEPLLSPTYKTRNFRNDQYKMSEIHEVKENRGFHDKKQTGKQRNKVLYDKADSDKQIHMSLHSDKVTPVHPAKPKVTPELSYKESDDEDVNHKHFIRTTPTLVFAKHKSGSDSNKLRACEWNSARKSNDGKTVSPVRSGHDITTAFEKIYSDAVTPKHAKTAPEASFEDEYVNIISPYDPLSGSKRQKNSKQRKHIVDSTQKRAIPNYSESVGSKVAVNADSKTQQLKYSSPDFTNSSHDLETDNFSKDERYEQIGANAQSAISCSSEEVYSEKKHSHFGDKNIGHAQEHLTASHDSARRKCYEKAFSKIRNMKNEEIKFNRYELHVRKRNCNSEKQQSQNLTNESSFSLNKSHSSINDSNDVKESASHSANCIILERNNSSIIQDQRQQSRGMDRGSLYSNEKSSIQCKGNRTKIKNCAEADRVLASRNKKSSEKYLTPISKSDDYQVITVNDAGSPEIIYKAETDSQEKEEGEFKGQTVVENHRKSEKYKFLKKMPRNWKESKVDDDRYKSQKHATDDNDQIAVAGKAVNNSCNNSHSLDSDKLLKSTRKREANQMQTDPYDFGYSPATDVKRISVGGIGERIQEKRIKVKKKARKSLVFQQNMDQSYTDSNQDISEFSPDEEAHSNYQHFTESEYRRKSPQDKNVCEHYIATHRKQVVNTVNNEKKPQERKRIIPAESNIPRKKQKVENIPAKPSNEVVRRVVKKSKLVKAFDTTYTIDFESPQHGHDRNAFN